MAAVGRMSLCAVIHAAASLSAGSVISTVTVKTAQTRRTVVCIAFVTVADITSTTKSRFAHML